MIIFCYLVLNIVMINYCPHCGHSLPQAITHGITSCSNCNRVFDSSPFNRLLSAAWMVRRRHYNCPELLIQHGFNSEEADLVIAMVADGCCGHEDFVKVLKDLNVSEEYQTCIDAA